MWYYIKLKDTLVKPTTAIGYVEANSKSEARKRGKELIGNKNHIEVVTIKKDDIQSIEDIKKKKEKPGYPNDFYNKNGERI